jgi:NhaP-type Na+/H+ or K+/H+ antiporter
LNDGICVPIVLFFLALATGSSDSQSVVGLVVKLHLQAIGIGVLVGVVGGVLGSRLLRISSVSQWIAGTWIQLPVISLTLLCFSASQFFGGSGFIACFVGGLLFGALAKRHKQEYLDAAEGIGDFMALVTWFVSGAAAIGLTWEVLNWRVVAYAIAGLTIVRMLPVFLSVAGLGLRLDTKLFIGWFGPRGLASIVFAVMIRGEHLPDNDLLLTIATWTILFSVVLHGITANPLATIFGKRVREQGGTVVSR